jgi:hypothetical protein
VSSKRYFLPVVGNGGTFADDRGTVLSSPDLARLQAAVIAAELAQDGNDYRGFLVRAADEEGNEVAQVPGVTSISDITYREPAATGGRRDANGPRIHSISE